MLCLSEQGLYFFLSRSDKPAALPFQKWIAGEVIPAIRKTGTYVRANASRSPAGAVSASLLRECRIGYREGVLSRRAIYRLLGLDGLVDMDMPGSNQTANLLLEERTKGLEFYQGLAEGAGLVKSDREDLEDTYRRWKG
jgi:hypothetical protein